MVVYVNIGAKRNKGKVRKGMAGKEEDTMGLTDVRSGGRSEGTCTGARTK